MTTIIETDRLIIRQITKEDAEGIYTKICEGVVVDGLQ